MKKVSVYDALFTAVQLAIGLAMYGRVGVAVWPHETKDVQVSARGRRFTRLALGLM